MGFWKIWFHWEKTRLEHLGVQFLVLNPVASTESSELKEMGMKQPEDEELTAEEYADEEWSQMMLAWYGIMNEIVERMTPEQRAELTTWERENILGDGGCATSDWPGFASLGLPPQPRRTPSQYGQELDVGRSTFF